MDVIRRIERRIGDVSVQRTLARNPGRGSLELPAGAGAETRDSLRHRIAATAPSASVELVAVGIGEPPGNTPESALAVAPTLGDD